MRLIDVADFRFAILEDGRTLSTREDFSDECSHELQNDSRAMSWTKNQITKEVDGGRNVMRRDGT